MYTIPFAAGTNPSGGPVLIHSFAGFSLNNNDIAQFITTSGGATNTNIKSIIARVSGSESMIDGQIDSKTYFPSASLFLVNPLGVMFGAHASVKVGNDFVATTANYVVLSDGSVFYVDPTKTNQSDPTPLITADVAAFGFLKGTSPQGITVNSGTTQTPFSSGGGLQFVGGGFSSTSANLSAASSILSVFSGGSVKGAAGSGLASPGDATVPYLKGSTTSYGVTGATTSYNGVNFGNAANFASFGQVNLQGAAMAANGSGGHVVIRGGALVVQNGATISSVNTTSSDTSVGSPIDIEGDSLALSGASSISSDTTGGGTGGAVSVTTDDTDTQNGGTASMAIGATTGGAGVTGTGVIEALATDGTAGAVHLDSNGTVALAESGSEVTSAGGAITLGANLPVGALTLAAGTKVQTSGAGGISVDGASHAPVTDSGSIAAGSGGVSLATNGTISLSGINQGISAAGGDINLGTVANPVASLTINTGASIEETTTSGAINIYSAGAVDLGSTGQGSITSSSGDGINLGSTSLTNPQAIGGLTIGATSTIQETGTGGIAINSSAAVSVDGTISSTGTGGIALDSAPTVTLSGSIVASGGSIALGSNVAIGNLTLNHGSSIEETAGAAAQTLSINVKTTGAINNSGTISTVTTGTTPADDLTVTGGRITLSGGTISSQATDAASGNGTAGAIGVTSTTGAIALSGGAMIESESGGAGTGTGGLVTVTAATNLTLDGNSEILGETAGTSSGMTKIGGTQTGASLSVNVTGNLGLTGSSLIKTSTSLPGNNAGNAGQITVADSTGAISLSGGSQIVSLTTGGGGAGVVSVNSTLATPNGANTITITGTGSASLNTGIFSLSEGTSLVGAGSAGSVGVVSGGSMILSNGGQIASDANAYAANASDVTVNVNSGTLDIGGTGPIIYSAAHNSMGAGGAVTVDALTNGPANIILESGASIQTISNDQSISPDGTGPSDITVNAQNLTINPGASIESSLVQGSTDTNTSAATGSIYVNVQNLLTLAGTNSSIETYAAPASASFDPLGTITVQTASLSVNGASLIPTFGAFTGYAPNIQAINSMVVNVPYTNTQVTTYSGASVLDIPAAGNGIVLAIGTGQLGTTSGLAGVGGVVPHTQVHNGYTYTIGDSDGILVNGQDLFLSFSSFNLGTSSDAAMDHINETAIFNVGSTVTNIVARVIGSAAQLDGKIAIIGRPSANLFFIDPAGIMVGYGGGFKGTGALTLSTANSLRLSTGGVFNASSDGTSDFSATDASITTTNASFSGTVAAFGFTSAPGPISFTGLPSFSVSSQLQVIGGAITLDDSSVYVASNQVFLFSAGAPADSNTPASLSFATNGGNDSLGGIILMPASTGTASTTPTPLATSFTESGFGPLGVITLDNSVLAGTSGDSGKPSTIYLRGGSYAQESSLIIDESIAGASTSTSGNVVINVEGDAAIDIDPMASTTSSYILASTFGNVNGGTVEIDAADLTITGPAANDSSNPVGILSSAEPVNYYNPSDSSDPYTAYHYTANATGSGGQINLFLGDSLSMSGFSQISADTNGPGTGGNIYVSAPGTSSSQAVSIRGGAQITSSTSLANSYFSSTGNAGTITVNSGSMTIDGGGLSAPTGISASAGVSGEANDTDTAPTGDGGNIGITIDGDLTILDGGQISASSFTQGYCGLVTVMQSGGDGSAITINGNSKAGTANATPGAQTTGILADCFGSGGVNSSDPNNPNLLAVSVTASGAVSITSNGEISSATFDNSSTAPAGALSLVINTGSLTIDGANSDGTSAVPVYVQGNLLTTGVTSSTYGGASAGDMNVHVTGPVSITSRGAISDGNIHASGQGGNLTVVINGDLTINPDGASTFTDTGGFNFTPTGITTSSFSAESYTGTAADIPQNYAKSGNLTVNVTGTVSILAGGQISSGSLNGGDGGTLTVTTGALTIDGTNTPPDVVTTLLYPTGIISASFEGGNAGSVTVTATGPVSIVNGGQITAVTYYTADFPSFPGLLGSHATPGNVSLTINDPALSATSTTPALSIDGSNVPQDGSGNAYFATGLLSSTLDGAEAGDLSVTVQSGSVSIRGGGQLAAETDGIGAGGMVTLKVESGSLTIDGATSGQASIPSTVDEFYDAGAPYLFDSAPVDLQTGLITSTSGQARAGSANVMVSGAVDITDGGVISSGTTDRTIAIGAGYSGSGLGGDVTLTAGSLTIDGTGATVGETGVYSSTTLPQGATPNPNEGNAGNLILTTTGTISLSGGGQISSGTSGNGSGGTVYVSGSSLSVDGVGTAISSSSSYTAATAGNGGDVNLSIAGAIAITDGGQVSATTAGGDGLTKGIGGGVFIGVPSTSAGLTSSQRNLTAPTSLTISGTSTATSSITSATFGMGHAGKIDANIAGALNITAGGQISSGTSGTGEGGTVDLSADSLTIDGLLANVTVPGTGISTSSTDQTTSAGTGGDVNLSITGPISISGGGVISASTENGNAATSGYGGNIFIGDAMLGQNAPTSLTVSGAGSEIVSDTMGGGNAGTIDATVAGPVDLEDGGHISSDTASTGTAGSITLTSYSLAMSGPTTAISTSSSGVSPAPGVTNDGTGTIILSVPGAITLDTGAQIAATTATGQSGGDITITQSPTALSPVGSLTLSDSQTAITAASTGALTTIGATMVAPGNSGSISIVTDGALTVSNHSSINSSSLNSNAGSKSTQAISISAQELVLEGGGTIDATAPSTAPMEGNGGNITLMAGKLLYLSDSDILTFAGDQGGNITIDPQFVILGNSLISAHGLTDGNIFIDASYLFESSSTIQATGTITLNTVPLDLAGSLIALPGQLTDEEKRLRESCARSVNHEFSSLIVVGRGGTESAPEELQPDFGTDALPQSSGHGTNLSQ